MFAYCLEWMQGYLYRGDIVGAAHLLNDVRDDDDFVNFTRGLIAKGRDFFENTLKDPDHLQILRGGDSLDNEGFGWVGRWAYAKKLGITTYDAMDFLFPHHYEKKFDLYIDSELYVAPEMEAWDFEDEEENRKRLLKLSALDYESQN